MFSGVYRTVAFVWMQLLLLTMFAEGQVSVYVLDTLKSEYELNDYLRVWEDSTEKATFENVSTPAFEVFFKPYNEVEPLSNRLGVYWGKAVIANHFREGGIIENWFLWIGQGSYVDVYFANPDGRLLEHVRTGELVPTREKKLATHNRVERVPFSLAMGDTLVVYARLQTIDYSQPVFKMKLTIADHLENAIAFKKNREDWFFLGFLVAIMLFSFLLFLTTRDKAFLYHSLFLLSATVFMLDMFGVTPDAPVLRNYPKGVLYLNYFSQACWDVFFLQFFRSYMHLEAVLPRWDRLLKNLIRLRIGYFIAVFLYFLISFNEVMTDYLTVSYVFVQYLIVLFFMAALYRLRDPKAYFLILATLFFVVGVGVNGYLIWVDIPINRFFSETAMIGEVLLFSLGLAYRMHQLQREEEEAHRLKALDDMKNRLYQNITHEFRTPLTVISGMAEQLLEKTAVNPERPLQLIRQSSSQLLKLVNRMLDLAKIESGHFQLHPVRGDMVAYLQQLVEFFQPTATQKGISLRFLTSLQSKEMDFDTEVTRQIFSNLLSNSLKFTPKNGNVTMAVESTGKAGSEQVKITVSDTGPGIPPDDLPFIFDRFYQAKNTTREQSSGTGIGLALTRELVTLAGGTIEVKSLEEHGTSFTVTLPVLLQAETALETIATIPLPAEEEWQPEIKPDYKSAAANGGRHLQKNLVLVIEDNPHIVEYLKSLLEDTYEVETAFNGQDGVEIALETIPDLVVSDVLMPKMDGFAVLQMLKKDSRTCHIPVILLTALASAQDRLAGLERGADAYLGKPFEGRELLAVLNNLLERRERWQAFFKKGEENAPAEPVQDEVPEDVFLKEAKEVLEKNLTDEDFGVLQLQRSLAVSRTQLHRKLKALTGLSTTEFINHLRLQKARSLLKDSELHISEIAYDTGFRDPNYFTRLFVKFYGKTPTEYRNALENVHVQSNAA